MTLTLERDPITAVRPRLDARVDPPAPPPRNAGRKPPRPRRPARWMALAALLVAGILTALVATADSASAPKDGGTSVELEPVEPTETKTPTKPSADGSGEATVPGPLGTGDETPACALPWSLLCPEKAKP